MNEYIHHVSCSKGFPDLFATAYTEKYVTVWSFQNKRKISELDTILDFGGRRLLISQHPFPVLITGAYQRYGLCAYDPFNGSVIWHRKDLNKVQRLRSGVFKDGKLYISVCIQSRPCHLIDFQTGDTIVTFRGINDIYPGSKIPSAIMVDKKYIKYYSFASNSFEWKVNKIEFAVLDCHIGEKFILVSEVGGPLRCFDHEGNELWQWHCPEEHHILNVMWDEKSNQWFSNMFSLKDESQYFIAKFDTNGNVEIASEIFDNRDCAFFEDSSIMVSENGAVIDVNSGKVLWVYEPNVKRKSEKKEYIARL